MFYNQVDFIFVLAVNVQSILLEIFQSMIQGWSGGSDFDASTFNPLKTVFLVVEVRWNHSYLFCLLVSRATKCQTMHFKNIISFYSLQQLLWSEYCVTVLTQLWNIWSSKVNKLPKNKPGFSPDLVLFWALDFVDLPLCFHVLEWISNRDFTFFLFFFQFIAEEEMDCREKGS